MADEEVLRITKKLKEIVAGTRPEDNASDLLKRLGQLPVDLDVLQKSRVGMVINELRKKTNDDSVASTAKSLIRSWKKMLDKAKTKNGTEERSDSSVGLPRNDSTANSLSELSSSQDTPESSQNHKAASGNDSNSYRQQKFPLDRSGEMDSHRKKYTEMLVNSLRSGDLPDGTLDPEELAERIEQRLFEFHSGTTDKYKSGLRSRVFNLRDKKNSELRENVLTGVVSPETFATMTSEEMASSQMKKMRDKFTKDAINEHQMTVETGTPTDMFKCGKCKKKNCTYTQVQTRSADEPMTTFVYCRECGNRWKLVPVNLARVQDTPAVVSHITAYNTKIDKVMDVLIYHPGIDLYRGSDCFVYWSDPQKGLTWGLNFISSEDASYFTDLACGKSKGILCRRANSAASLSNTEQGRARSTSVTGSSIIPARRHGGSKHSVKFADPPVSKSADHSRQTTPTPSKRNSASPQPEIPDPFQLYVTGKRLSDWSTMLPMSSSGSEPNSELNFSMVDPGRASTSRNISTSFNSGFYDNLENIAQYSGSVEDSVGVWKPQAESSDAPPLRLSIDSATLQKMLNPIVSEREASSSERFSAPPSRKVRSATNSLRKPVSDATSSSTSSLEQMPSISETSNVVLRQNEREIILKETPRTKRSSLHLVPGFNGTFQNVTELVEHDNTPRDPYKPENQPFTALDDSASLSSSQDGSSLADTCLSPPGSGKSSKHRTRKAGFLLLKRWLTPRDRELSLTGTDSWHQYWALLKGFNIHFYSVVPRTPTMDSATPSNASTPSTSPTEKDPSSKVNQEPSIVIDLLNCLVQPVPEYPRRQNVFCMSTGIGQAFLVQVSSELELESWMCGVHTAAALALARTSSREVALRTMRKEMDKVEKKLETIAKMIRLSQLPSVSSVSVNQVGDWEEEYELHHIQHFMIRCYWSAIKNTELPSCKKVLASASTRTKAHLSQMGAFTVSSMHALVFAKSVAKRFTPAPQHLSSPRHSLQLSESRKEMKLETSQSPNLLQIGLPSGQVTVITVGEWETAGGALRKACEKVGLSPARYFLGLRNLKSMKDCLLPQDSDPIHSKLTEHHVELRERLVYHTHLRRKEHPRSTLGLTVRAQRTQDQLSAFITGVEEEGVAKRKGIMVGDEILHINLQSVRVLTSQVVEQLLQDTPVLCLVLRTKRPAIPVWLEHLSISTSQESLNLTCGESSQHEDGSSPAGEEGDMWLSDSCGLLRHKVKYRKERASLIRGKQRYSLPIIPQSALLARSLRESLSANSSPRHIDDMDRHHLDQSAKRMSSSEPGGIITNGNTQTSTKLSSAARLEKIIYELLETEKAYLESLERLREEYLEPLRKKEFFPPDESALLLSSTAAILRFQKSFLEELEEASHSGDSRSPTSYSSHSHLRQALLRIGGVFLNASSRLKVYSSFCASHFRVQKLLKQERGNDALQSHLKSCNAENQHSSTFESYLIKPVQRILRYPLFLQQMKSLTGLNSPENLQISEALTKMEKVAEYVNEMQRIYEEYGNILSQVQSESPDVIAKGLNLELSELLMFGELEWLNFVEETGKKKNGIPVECLCFIFRTAILIVPLADRQKGRKSKRLSIGENTSNYRLIPIAEVEINGSDAGSTDSQHFWILIHMNLYHGTEKIYRFSNRRHDVKHQFLRAIRKAGHNLSRESPLLRQEQFVLTNSASTSNETSNGVSEDRVYLSSPDSGFPQSSVPQGNGIPPVNGPRRPGSYYSSQSDAGYGSNSELHRKEITQQLT